MSVVNPASNGVLTAQRFLRLSQTDVNRELNRIATGFRINAGKDDPAGLIAAENMSKDIRRLEALDRAAERNNAVANIAEGALASASSLLVEAERLAVASANSGAISASELEANQLQFDSLVQSIDRTLSTSSFNGQKLFSGEVTIPSTGGGDPLELPALTMSTLGEAEVDDGSGGTKTVRLSDVLSGGSVALGSPDAQAAIEAAASQINTLRADIGAFQTNIIEPTQQSNLVALENTSAARSVIQDTDYASATSSLSRGQVLTQSGIEALLTAGSNSAAVLTLLG